MAHMGQAEIRDSRNIEGPQEDDGDNEAIIGGGGHDDGAVDPP